MNDVNIQTKHGARWKNGIAKGQTHNNVLTYKITITNEILRKITKTDKLRYIAF